MRRLPDSPKGCNQYGANTDKTGTGKRVASEGFAEDESRKDRIED